jgi:hypothetical protein
MPSIGDSFRLRVDLEEGHLWIVITEVSSEGKFIMVNLTTLDEDIEDTSCILCPGDHPYITHPSVISYKDTKEFDTSFYDRALAAGRIHSYDRFSQEIVRKIQQGALTSNFTKNRFRAVIQANLAAPSSEEESSF